VYLNVTSLELLVLDQRSNDVIQTSDVGQVIFFAIHPKDKKTLCYVTKSKCVNVDCLLARPGRIATVRCRVAPALPRRGYVAEMPPRQC